MLRLHTPFEVVMTVLPVIILGDCCVERFTDGTKLKCERCNEFIERIDKCAKPLCRDCKVIWDKEIKLNSNK